MIFISSVLKFFRSTTISLWLEKNFFSKLCWLIIYLVSQSLKIRTKNFDVVKKLKQEKKKVIYTFFHGEQFVLVFLHRHQNIVIMTSLSRDGELQTEILKKFGYDIVRGSTKKGYTSGTIAMMDKLSKKQDVAIAVDGPKGPGFKVKPGAVFLAQKTGSAIVPVRVRIKDKIQFNNWDRYMIPLFFTECEVIYGSPIFVSSNDSVKEKTSYLEKLMLSL